MPLELEPVRVVYDDERDIVTFMGMDGARMVRCSVTRDALRALSRRRAESAKEMLEAYRTHASSIHRIAVRKYEQRQLDHDGSVFVLQRDVVLKD
ncbi:MAG TPA: DUF1488 family protein [Dongiaceae bacterium]|jgi:hypothetical protein